MALGDSPFSFDGPYRGPFVGSCGRNFFFFRISIDSMGELVIFIFNILFDWVSIWADFEELEWYAIWCEEMQFCFIFSSYS